MNPERVGCSRVSFAVTLSHNFPGLERCLPTARLSQLLSPKASTPSRGQSISREGPRRGPKGYQGSEAGSQKLLRNCAVLRQQRGLGLARLQDRLVHVHLVVAKFGNLANVAWHVPHRSFNGTPSGSHNVQHSSRYQPCLFRQPRALLASGTSPTIRACLQRTSNKKIKLEQEDEARATRLSPTKKMKPEQQGSSNPPPRKKRCTPNKIVFILASYNNLVQGTPNKQSLIPNQKAEERPPSRSLAHRCVFRKAKMTKCSRQSQALHLDTASGALIQSDTS